MSTKAYEKSMETNQDDLAMKDALGSLAEVRSRPRACDAAEALMPPSHFSQVDEDYNHMGETTFDDSSGRDPAEGGTTQDGNDDPDMGALESTYGQVAALNNLSQDQCVFARRPLRTCARTDACILIAQRPLRQL